MPKLYLEAGRFVVPGKQGRGAERVDIPSNPELLAEWLNAFSPAERFDPALEDAPAPAPIAPSSGGLSLALDDAWDALPLPHQLHFASLALERARVEIKPKGA